jgi:glycosyltransferase involved in cell wall biosynthesis
MSAKTALPLIIALDATYSLGRNLSGVGVYSRRLLWGLAAAHPASRLLFCYRPHRFLRSFQEQLPENAARRVLAPLLTPAVDVFHALNQRPAPVRARRVAVTFHDLFVLTAEYSTPEFRTRFAAQARQAAAAADLIIAVSAYTASVITDVLGVDPSRIRVVPHGVDPPPARPPASRKALILHTGAIQKRKNCTRLVRAFETLPPPWRMVFAGASGYAAEETFAAIAASPARDRIEVRGYVSHEDLAQLYSEASIFAFPSLDEGFGIPILEAMAWGVPVLTSNRSSLPEVAGDAALLVDPLDEDAIAAGLRRLSEDTSVRETLLRRGYQRAANFTWNAAVEKTWAVYEELTG